MGVGRPQQGWDLGLDEVVVKTQKMMEKFSWFSWTRVGPLLLDGPRLGGKEPQLRLTRRKHLSCSHGMKLRPGNCSWQANRRHHFRIQAGPVEANCPGASKTHWQCTIAL